MTQVDPKHDAPVAERPAEQTDVELFGIVGEFEDVDSVLDAARACREAGYRYFDVHSPFPLHQVDKVIGAKPTVLPWIVFICGLTGAATGLVLTTWTMATNVPLPYESFEGYPYLISGKPYLSLPAFIPVIFELTILLSAFGAVFGMLLLNRLPQLYHPLLKLDRFRRATSDRFFVAIEARDSKFDANATAEFLRQHGASAVELVEE